MPGRRLFEALISTCAVVCACHNAPGGEPADPDTAETVATDGAAIADADTPSPDVGTATIGDAPQDGPAPRGEAGVDPGPVTPTICDCPQPTAERPKECLPCGAVLSENGSCLPPQQTAPTCAPPPAVCNCASPGPKAPPAACGCSSSFDWFDNLAKLAGVSKDKLTAADVAKKAKAIDGVKNKTAVSTAQQGIAKGQQLVTGNAQISAKLASAISSLAGAAEYSVKTTNTTVSAGTCTAGTGDLACSGLPIFASFVVNFHDFVNYERSFSLLLDLVKYHTDAAVLVPLNVYLDTQLLDVWVAHYGESNLMALFSANPSLLVVSYHLRAPTPYADDSYWRDWQNTAISQIDTLVTAYETFAMDRSDGELAASGLGGYSYLKTLAGYAPPVVTGADASAGGSDHAVALKTAMAAYYSASGAALTVTHAGSNNAVVDVCTRNSTKDLHLRPESMALPAYQLKSDKSSEPAKLFATLVSTYNSTWTSAATAKKVSVGYFDAADSPLLAKVQATKSQRIFVNFKWHDNNFYMNLTPWLRIYANDESAYSAVGSGGTTYTHQCNTKVDCDATVLLEDWSHNWVFDKHDVCPKVEDNKACGLTSDNLNWDLSRGVDAASYEAYCAQGDTGATRGGCASRVGPLSKAECERKCAYVKKDVEKNALVANYKALLAYMKANPRFRVVSGSTEAAMATSTVICPILP